jgi:hypothetical protein
MIPFFSQVGAKMEVFLEADGAEGINIIHRSNPDLKTG